MKLSSRTVSILKNYATINPSLVVEPGNVLRTVSPIRSVVAKAEVAETFPKPFAIYNLTQFLAAASIGADPDFDFGDKSVTIASGDTAVTYWYANPDLIKVKASDVTMPSEDVAFDLPSAALKDVTRGATTLSLPTLFFTGNADGIYVCAGDALGNTNNIRTKIADGDPGHKFNTIFAIENVKFIDSSYHVVVCKRGVASFTDTADTGGILQYFVASSKDSTFA